MRIALLLVILVSSLITGCDRNTLQGLNLKFNGEIKSDYEQKNDSNQNQTKYNTEIKPEQSQEPANNQSEPENIPDTLKNKPIQQVNNTKDSDPDAPMVFKPISDCTKSGITAKTNEIFYSNNSQVKSIDSKDEKQLKAWQEIYNKVEASCQ
jgi:hypothetical protein